MDLTQYQILNIFQNNSDIFLSSNSNAQTNLQNVYQQQDHENMMDFYANIPSFEPIFINLQSDGEDYVQGNYTIDISQLLKK